MDARPIFSTLIINAPNQSNRITVAANNVGELKKYILDNAGQLGLNSNFPPHLIKIYFKGKEVNDDGYSFSSGENLNGVTLVLPKEIEKKYKAGYIEPPPLPPRKPRISS